MSKANWIRAGSLTVMVAIIAWLLTAKTSSNLAVAPDIFQVEAQEEIDHIRLLSATDTLDLAFTGTRWQLDRSFAADRRMIKVFFATLDQVRPLRQVVGSEADSARAWLGKTGVDVALYKKDLLVFGFRAGGNPAKTVAYYIHPGGDVYAMHIPGYRVYASGVFEAAAAAWRDKRIFDFNWQKFKSLVLTTPEPGDRFEIVFTGSGFGMANTDTDTARLNSYLDEVSLMTADEFYVAGSSGALDSVLKTRPAFEIRVEDISGRTYDLAVFPPVVREPQIAARLNGEPIVLSREKAAILAKKMRYFHRGQAR